MNIKELFKNDLARCRRKIDKFNGELEAYVKMTGDNLVPDIDCTLIGCSAMNPITYKEEPRGFTYIDDGLEVVITIESDCGEYWLSGEDELDDTLKYYRRRLHKGIRVWKSENPDAEMEKEDEEQ